MANANEIERLNYFHGQLLTADDFTAEQTYHEELRRLHNRTLHTPGIAEGLMVTGALGDASVTVAAGAAVDPQGRLYQLAIAQVLALPSTNGSYVVVASYHEQPAPGVDTAGQTDTRIIVGAMVQFKTAAASGDVALARVDVQNGKVNSAIDLGVRQSVGTSNLRVEDAGGTTIARIEPQGPAYFKNPVGVGTSQPAAGAMLDVAGTVKAKTLQLDRHAVDQIIDGTIQSDGTLVSGTGAGVKSVTRNSLGFYTVELEQKLGDTPLCVATSLARNGFVQSNANGGVIKFYGYAHDDDTGKLSLADMDFSFLVISVTPISP